MISKEVMIPLYQKCSAKGTEVINSSQFKSKTKKIDFMDLSERPGPGDYQTEQKRGWKSSLAPFGFNDNNRNVYMNRDISCPFQDKSVSPEVGKYSAQGR